MERLGVGGKVWEGVGGLWFLVDARWVRVCEWRGRRSVVSQVEEADFFLVVF